MRRVRWTAGALEDLQEISEYIEGRSDLATANRVCRILYDAVQMLRRFPGAGKPGMEAGTREFVVPALPAYILVYRVIQDDAVQVMRLWHGARQRDG